MPRPYRITYINLMKPSRGKSSNSSPKEPKTGSLPVTVGAINSWILRFRVLLSSLTKVEPRPYLRSTGWDDLLGFNAYSYRSRLSKVAELAKKDFQKRGIEVESLNLYVSDRGIYCSWALVVP